MRNLERREDQRNGEFQNLLLERLVIALDEIEKLPVELREPRRSAFATWEFENRKADLQL